MTDLPPNAAGEPEPAPGPADAGSGRTASVTLRAATPTRTGERGVMDPANKSLADALRISYFALCMGMVLLAVLFFVSGFRTVQENERGIRVMFGAATDRALQPGGHLTWPHPIGEMVPVDVGAVSVSIDLPFFVRPRRSGDGIDDFDFSPDRLPQPPKLDPAQHGSLITADGAIAHTRWQVIYRRIDFYDYAENITPESEREIVSMAVQRGVVHAVATTTIDDLLKQSSGENASVAQVARRLAQQTLTEIGSGLQIDNLYMVDKLPPTRLIADFNAVAQAESVAGQRREVAEQTRRTTLNTVAGTSAEMIVDAIDAYELSLTSPDIEAQNAALARVFAMLEGTSPDAPPVSGEVARILEAARVQADSSIRTAESQTLIFNAKLEQFRANPTLMVTRDWTSAYTRFLGREDVEVWRAPSGSTETLELVINRDPDIVERTQQAVKARQAQESFEEREQRLMDVRRQERNNRGG